MADRRRPRKAVTSTHEVQAAIEGVPVDDGRKVEFMGETFQMAEKIGMMPLMHLAVAGKKGVDAADMDGLVAMYEVLRDCIDQTRPQEDDPDNPGGTRDAGRSEWDRFEQHAVDMKADPEDLQKVVTDVIEAVSARPTGSPRSSLAGRQTTSGNSKASSPATVTRRQPLPKDLT